MKRSPSGPMGHIPGLLWDEQRQRYFSPPPRGAATATAQPSDAAAEPRRVAELPVAPAVAKSLAETGWILTGMGQKWWYNPIGSMYSIYANIM